MNNKDNKILYTGSKFADNNNIISMTKTEKSFFDVRKSEVLKTFLRAS